MADPARLIARTLVALHASRRLGRIVADEAADAVVIVGAAASTVYDLTRLGVGDFLTYAAQRWQVIRWCPRAAYGQCWCRGDADRPFFAWPDESARDLINVFTADGKVVLSLEDYR